MDLPGNRPWVARNQFWGCFLKCTMRYESYLLSRFGDHKCQAFPKMHCKMPKFFLPFFTFYAVRSSAM